jgi:GrpB-like predicted nucleotidyltransferase (UPF0157 family)
MPEPVIVVAYSPDWPRQFEQIREALLAALGDLAIAVEHMGSTELLRHLAFRDALRRNPHLVEDYAAVKRELAASFREDRLGYSEAKTAFVEAVLRRG